MSDTRTVFEMGVREYARTPLLLALLVFLPAYFILVFTWVMPDRAVPVSVAGSGTVMLGTKAVVAVLMTPMATALVGGAAGLFLMQSAREVDGRLAIVGMDVRSVLLARGAVVAVAAVVATLVATAVLGLTHVPESPGPFLVATLLVGLTYGAIGALVGVALNRLAGIYVLMFGPLLDIFLAQSPLSDETHVVAPYLPSYYPMRLAFDAGFTAGVDLSNLWFGLAYFVAVGVVVGGVFYRTLRIR